MSVREVKTPADFQLALEGVARCLDRALEDGSGGPVPEDHTKALWEVGSALWAVVGQLSEANISLRELRNELNAIAGTLEDQR